MDDGQFEEHVRAALDSLPEDIATGLENVAVVVEEEIRITVVHEIAHHFGIDEDRLAELGWG